MTLKEQKAKLSSEIIYFVRTWMQNEPVKSYKKRDEFYKMLAQYDDLCDKIEDAMMPAERNTAGGGGTNITEAQE